MTFAEAMKACAAGKVVFTPKGAWLQMQRETAVSWVQTEDGAVLTESRFLVINELSPRGLPKAPYAVSDSERRSTEWLVFDLDAT